MPEQIQTVFANLQSFGPKRLAILAAIGALVFAVIGVSAVYLNRPAYETLYVGLERSDVNQIGIALGEAGIHFDVNSDGTSVMVPVGKTAQARMLLAEKGLPTSTNAGYELFDNVGSLGLTSFMQQVTRVRALEGEIARTIQSIAGIKAARVHIVMSESANFRREEQKPSASVVIRTAGGGDATRSAISIRHLVSAAVPGLDSDNVTVLDSTGTLLAAGDDPANNSLSRSISVERTVESQIGDNIHRALAPYLGADNFRASVKAEVNTDTQQIEEMIFDPESRVERSIQVVRANENASQRSTSTPTTVEQNLPDEAAPSTAGPQSSEESERKEEITNYELNSKRIATVSNGYSLSKMSIAVVVNEERLRAILGETATPEQIAERIAEIQQVVAAATGFDDVRGDNITVTSVEFIAPMADEAVAGAGMLETVGRYAGSMINAAAFIIVVFLVAWFGLRPLATALATPAFAGGPSFDEMQRSLPGPSESQSGGGAIANQNGGGGIDDLRQKIRPAPQERLAKMVDLNEERTALILRKWAHPEAS